MSAMDHLEKPTQTGTHQKTAEDLCFKRLKLLECSMLPNIEGVGVLLVSGLGI